jgi:hypothetical protein
VIEFVQNQPLLKWNNELKASDLVASLALCFALVALLLTFLQIRRGSRTRKGDLLLKMFDDYFGNEHVREMYYKLDYGDWQFDLGSFPLSADEPHIDYLLYFFDTLGLMLKRREITLNEVEIFAFQANQVLRNEEMQKYLQWLNQQYAQSGRPSPAHSHALYLRDRISVRITPPV